MRKEIRISALAAALLATGVLATSALEKQPIRVASLEIDIPLKQSLAPKQRNQSVADAHCRVLGGVPSAPVCGGLCIEGGECNLNADNLKCECL